jgi:hypothetical protein
MANLQYPHKLHVLIFSRETHEELLDEVKSITPEKNLDKLDNVGPPKIPNWVSEQINKQLKNQ